ncbi:MAG: carboxypeptidase-like regulatory domain-containing protein, partial [Flavobacteriaceae bacterium]|nr:carboxypeptidase-like regulatory domain-containing protein [Flavobacteriaceae bacterium]
MKNKILLNLSFLFTFASAVFAQTKVSGVVVDKLNHPVPFANVAFKNSSDGVVSNEDGIFYLESPKTYTTIVITSVGYSDKELDLEKAVNYNLKIR